jgi:hypothetical protein
LQSICNNPSIRRAVSDWVRSRWVGYVVRSVSTKQEPGSDAVSGLMLLDKEGQRAGLTVVVRMGDRSPIVMHGVQNAILGSLSARSWKPTRIERFEEMYGQLKLARAELAKEGLSAWPKGDGEWLSWDDAEHQFAHRVEILKERSTHTTPRE